MKQKILVADDEPDVLEIITYNLNQAGFITETAKDGEEFLNKMESFHPDLALLDISMPFIDGVEACRIIRSQKKFDDVRIIFLSGRHEEYSKIAALDAGGDMYINKPIRPRLLVTYVRTELRKKRVRGLKLPSYEEEYIPITVNPVFRARSFDPKTNYCFILMPFGKKWSNRVLKKLKEIMNEYNYKVKRADDLYGHNILEDIWIAINEASIIIADITSKNANVMYEIGIAHTLGKNVILLTQSTDDIPFDFKQYRHIVYEDNADGFQILEESLPKYLEKIIT